MTFCFEKLYDADEVYRKWPESVTKATRVLTLMFFECFTALISHNIKSAWEVLTRVLGDRTHLHMKPMTSTPLFKVPADGV